MRIPKQPVPSADFDSKEAMLERFRKIENCLMQNEMPPIIANAIALIEKIMAASDESKADDRDILRRLSAAFIKIKEMFNAKIKDKLARCKNVHFMSNDKFTNPSIEFINKHFANEDNLFLVARNYPDSYTAQKFPQGENVAESNFSLLYSKDFADKNKKLIFHSFFDQLAVLWLYQNKDLLSHSYWMVWGGDFYQAPEDEISDFVRKNVYGIGSVFDKELIMEKYGEDHAFFPTHLAVPPTPLVPDIAQKIRNSNEASVIQVNNSADASTLQMLDVLARYKDENIKIRTVLSYGKTDFNQEIISKGKFLFGDKFSYLDKMLEPNLYAEYLSQNDILILCQSRQQGVGNLYTSMALGKKIFVGADTTAAKMISPRYKIFDSAKIKDMDFDEFCEFCATDRENNIKLLQSDAQEEKTAKVFALLLNGIAG